MIAEKPTMTDPLRLTCPCCSTRLAVDRESGEILSEERPKADPEASFEQAMQAVRTGGQRREDAFSKAFERTKNLDDLLSKKFDEAKRKAADDTTPWRNPLDNE